MKKLELLRWAIRTLTYTVVWAIAIASICAYEPLALCAGIVTPFISVFWLSIAYRRVDGVMNIQSDALYLGTLLLFAALVAGLAPVLCAWFVKYSNGVCYRESGSCLILIMPGCVIAFSVWVMFRVKQYRQRKI